MNSVGILGINTSVGQEIVSVLEEREFPISELVALTEAANRSLELDYKGKRINAVALGPNAFHASQIVFCAGGSALSKKWAEVAIKGGATVIDLSSSFRQVSEIPLIVPEVNGDELRKFLAKKRAASGILVSTPNCSAIQLSIILKPLQEKANIRRVVVSTYQSVSGAGKKGMQELWEQTLAIFRQETPTANKFPHQIAFNCIPQVDSFLPDGSTKEEAKVIQETRKLLGLPDLSMSVTAVRVPVFICHSQSVNIEFESEVTPEEVRQILNESPGIIVSDKPEESEYPIGIDVRGTEATYVGRIRRDSSVPHGINLWIVADNIRKGGALNAVQVAEILAHEQKREGKDKDDSVTAAGASPSTVH